MPYSHPVISIILPNYNGAKTIEASILTALNQSFNQIELIIVDDASTDNSIEIIRNLQSIDKRIILICNKENKGVAQSRNLGFEASKGKYIAFLDSDDLWNYQKLEKQMNEIKCTNCDICFTSYQYINAKNENVGKPYVVPLTTNYINMLKENVIGCSTVLMKKELLNTFSMNGEFAHEDYVLWLEILKTSRKAIGIVDVLVYYRVGGRSSNKFNAAWERWRVYRYSQNLSLFTSVKYFSLYIINGIKKMLISRI